MTFLTFDLETENYTLNKRLASPFDKRNYIVQAGWKVDNGPAQEKYFEEWHREPVLPVDVLDTMGEGDILIGLNIKFDLLWVWEEPALQAALKRGMQIYCCQYAEYLMGGMVQDVQLVSMNQIAGSYGGGVKVDAVKEMWEAGYKTSEIPRDLLTTYLIGDGEEVVGDIENTWRIFVGQVKRMKEEHPPEFRTMFKFRMDGLLATTEMEYNGMYIDMEVGEELCEKNTLALEAATKELEEFIPELPPELEFNWNSPVHKSCLIFGGTVKYQKWIQHEDENGNGIFAKKKEEWPLFTYQGKTLPVSPDDAQLAGSLYVLEVPKEPEHTIEHKGKYYIVQDTFKGGKKKGFGKTKKVDVPDLEKPKGAKQDHFFTFPGYTKPLQSWQNETTDAFDKPLYSTDASVIEKLSTRGLPFTNALAKRAKISKDLSSYYRSGPEGKQKGMLTLVGEDGIIHHKLNHCQTVTSRLSSSDPNLQTLPRADEDSTGEAKSEVKKMFRSRFGKSGRMAEIDYSQLEVVVQGVLSNDKQLCQDLNDKVDFHCKRLAAKLGEPYEDVLRKVKQEEIPEYILWRTGVKRFSFQRAYGAGAAAIALSTGMPEEDVKALIQAEEELYPGVVQFDKRLEKAINDNRISTDRRIFINGVAFTQGMSHWDSPTGTRYCWVEGLTPEFMHKHGKYTGFSPTERKNYPVQGFGGEIVQTMLGRVFRYFMENDRFGGKVLLVNTVHDCVVIDGEAEIIEPVVKKVTEILQDVPNTFNKAFDKLNITVPFPCEAEIGEDLFDMHGLH